MGGGGLRGRGGRYQRLLSPASLAGDYADSPRAPPLRRQGHSLQRLDSETLGVPFRGCRIWRRPAEKCHLLTVSAAVSVRQCHFLSSAVGLGSQPCSISESQLSSHRHCPSSALLDRIGGGEGAGPTRQPNTDWPPSRCKGYVVVTLSHISPGLTAEGQLCPSMGTLAEVPGGHQGLAKVDSGWRVEQKAKRLMGPAGDRPLCQESAVFAKLFCVCPPADLDCSERRLSCCEPVECPESGS